MNAYTIRVNVSAAYKDGSFLMEDQTLAADTILRESKQIHDSRFQFVDIRLAVPYNQMEELVDALRTGKVDLTIDGARSKVDQIAA